MSRPPLIVLEVVLGFVVPLGWGVWQLVALRRDQRQADAKRLAEAADPCERADPPAPAAPRRSDSG